MIEFQHNEFIKDKYNDSLKKEIYNNTKMECCPHCNNAHFIKYGTFKGIQRYKCKNCGKTFSSATKSVYSYSKKYISDWCLYFKYMLEKKSLRFISEKVGISLSTAFIWRHKIMEGLKNKVVSDKLEGKVFIIISSIKDNFKGCRNIEGLQLGRRGYVKICAAYGRLDSLIAAPISRIIFLYKVFEERIYSKISKDAYIVPYTYAMEKVAARHNKWIVLNDRREKRIESFTLKFPKWIGEFHGVATRYLQRYLYYYGMFILFKKFTKRDILCILNEKINFKYFKYKIDFSNIDHAFIV